MEGIGTKIKNVRELRNYTQDFMAEKLGITQAGYCKIERGETDVPYSRLEEIATILQVKVEDLIAFDQQRFFHSFNNVKGNNNGSVTITDASKELKKLYQEKITLLETIVKMKDERLTRYQDKFGDI